MIGGGGGGRGHSASAFYSVKLCVMINFSLRHNVLCFSLVVVLYSLYSLYDIIIVVLLNERDIHRDIHFEEGGGGGGGGDDSYLKSDF